MEQGIFEMRYRGPMLAAARMEQTQNQIEFLNLAVSMMQAFPAVAEAVDPHAALLSIAENQDVPVGFLKKREDYDAAIQRMQELTQREQEGAIARQEAQAMQAAARGAQSADSVKPQPDSLLTRMLGGGR